MNKDEVVSLAKESGALICSGAMSHYTYPPDLAGMPCPDSISFDPCRLIAFANACEKIGMEKAAKICDEIAQKCAEVIRSAT